MTIHSNVSFYVIFYDKLCLYFDILLQLMASGVWYSSCSDSAFCILIVCYILGVTIAYKHSIPGKNYRTNKEARAKEVTKLS